MNVKGLISTDSSYYQLRTGGDISSVSFVIDPRLPARGSNMIQGRYSACESIARAAVDEEGFLFMHGQYSSDKDIATVLCYGKKADAEGRTLLCVGVGANARTAKKAIFSDDSREVEFVREAFRVKTWEAKKVFHRSTPVVMKYDKTIDFDINGFPRDFTWEVPDYPGEIKAEYAIFHTENGDFHICGREDGVIKIFQNVDNDFATTLNYEYGEVDNCRVFVSKTRSTKRDCQHGQFVVFGQFFTKFGEIWSGYESANNPFFDLDAIIDQMRVKVTERHRSGLDQALGRGGRVDLETALKYFQQHRFVATPAHSGRVGNCPVGTWRWIKDHLKVEVEEPGNISWQNFPIPVDQEYRIPFKQLKGWAKEDYSFGQVVLQRYREEKGVEGLTPEHVRTIVFGPASERNKLLKRSEVAKVKKYFTEAGPKDE